MANPLVEAMKIGEEKARQEMQIAEDAYNEQWRDQVDWGPQDPEPGEPVFGTEEGGQGFFEFVKSLQISPKDVEMAMEMWPNLRGIGVNVPSADDTGASDDYYGTPSNNPDMPDGWQLANLLDGLKIDPTAHKGAQKKTKIYNKATQGSGSEKDWLKKTGPQLPLAHNYRQGPPTDGIKDIIIQRSNELMNAGEKDKAIELMKIVPGLLQQA